jgi:hypothetical protein
MSKNVADKHIQALFLLKFRLDSDLAPVAQRVI